MCTYLLVVLSRPRVEGEQSGRLLHGKRKVAGEDEVRRCMGMHHALDIVLSPFYSFPCGCSVAVATAQGLAASCFSGVAMFICNCCAFILSFFLLAVLFTWL